jgi:hypothetical protein
MEETMKNSLNKRGFVFKQISVPNENIEECIVEYLCKCQRETSKKWSMARKVAVCGVCLAESKIETNNKKIRELGKSIGYEVLKIEREKTPHKTTCDITYKCICGAADTVMLATFKQKDFKGCQNCRLGRNDNQIYKNAEIRGYKITKIDRPKGEKTRTKVDIICICGKPRSDIKLESFNKPEFRGCDECVSKSRSETNKAIKAGEGMNALDSIFHMLKINGFENVSHTGDKIKEYKFDYTCLCKNSVSKGYASVKSDPLCQECMGMVRKFEKDDEIKKFMKQKGHTVLKVLRDDSSKSRINLDIVCVCGKREIRLWDVGKRDEFTGCENCYTTNNINNVIPKLREPEANEKREITNMEEYGVPCTLQSKEVRDKMKETVIKIFGVENVSQSANIHIKQQRFEEYISESGRKYMYQGYENFAIKRLIHKLGINENNISMCHDLCEKGEMPTFDYKTDDGKNHVYFPDIRITDNDGSHYFIEVKSPSLIHSTYLDLKTKAVMSKGYKILIWRFNRVGSFLGESLG